MTPDLMPFRAKSAIQYLKELALLADVWATFAPPSRRGKWRALSTYLHSVCDDGSNAADDEDTG